MEASREAFDDLPEWLLIVSCEKIAETTHVPRLRCAPVGTCAVGCLETKGQQSISLEDQTVP
jgi:hypothetical protein